MRIGLDEELEPARVRAGDPAREAIVARDHARIDVVFVLEPVRHHLELQLPDGPEQQAAAENLIAVTVVRLPQWSDYRVAEAAGFHSIGDGLTGFEHFINWDWINDDVTLDPDHPESLVYKPQPDGTIVYAHIISPVVKGADYSVLQNIYTVVTDPAQQRALYDKYAGAFGATLMQVPFSTVSNLGQ